MVKSEVRKQPDGTVYAVVVGKIDEHFDGREILEAAAGTQKVTLKLDGIRSITSLGVRALESFMRALAGREIVMEEISAAMANQFTMIPNLLGGATVQTARLPFVCPSCGNEKLHAIPYQPGGAASHAPTCDCGAKMEFDGFSEEYLPH
jgi:hypothetical protein